MFGIFRKKKKKPEMASILELDDLQFMTELKSLIHSTREDSCSMTIVAYINHGPEVQFRNVV